MNYNFILFIKVVIFVILLIVLYFTILKILFNLYLYFEKNMINDDVYLFFYGSNSINQIKERLNIKSDIEYYPSHIKNHCRIFAGFSKRWNSAIASIYPLLNNNVYGITIKINKKYLEEMDKFEKGYSRIMIKVYFETKKKYYDCYVYIKDNLSFYQFPSIKYLEAINKMLNDRYSKSSNKLNRKIMIRIKKNENIINLGNWTNENGIKYSISIEKKNIINEDI
jgi:hypothetical protein